jgi:hypothetical protein
MRYRAALRGFDLAALEDIIRHSSERYVDMETGRSVIVGRHQRQLVMVPCEIGEEGIVPITVHATNRQQIRFRLQTGRFTNE